jgi:hypothetical protein
MGGIYEVIVEMGSGIMTYIPSFVNIDSGFRRDTQTHRQRGDHINLLSFLQNKESRLKIGKQKLNSEGDPARRATQ